MKKIIRLTKTLASSLRYSKNDKNKNTSHNRYNLFHNDVLLDITVRKIKNFEQKYKSLLFKSSTPYNQGFCVIGSKGFNSFGFYKKVDVVFCDIKKRVFALYENFEPNKITSFHKETYSIYVFFPGAINLLNIEEDDILRTKLNVI